MDLYAQNIMEHAKHPQHTGVLSKPSCTYKELNPYCGDEVEVDLQVTDDKITDIAFRGQGCAISQAAMSILTEEIVHQDIQTILKFGQQEIQDLLGMTLTQRRKKCALLGLLAIQNAILQHRKKPLKTWKDLFID